MAERLLGESSLSASLRSIFDRMESPGIIDFIRGGKLNGLLRTRLKAVLLSINEVLQDAEEKVLWNRSVREWIDAVKDVIYDADDIVDDIYTMTLQSKLEAEFETNSIKVRNCIPASLFVDKIERTLKMILGRLEDLSRQKDFMGLRVSVGTNLPPRMPTTFLVSESSVFGRRDDKEEIIKNLLSDDEHNNEMVVIAIVGMGGIGKTTLAQLIYNDDRVKGHFDLRAWVYVSEDFDVYRITKSVLESVTGYQSFKTLGLNQLQVRLHEILMGKKFLIVLDDVWNKNYVDWEVLSKPFTSGAQGCKIIATTRDVGVASVMRARTIYHLKKLGQEDCWSLFARHAFRDGNANASPDLEILGRQIVKKCKGLPLAVKALGALLSFDSDVHYWESVLEGLSRNWGFEQSEVLPVLMLSYKLLPSNLKQCFAYCSLFPKDYVFETHELVLLWMAEGFVDTSGREDFEEVGYDYFHDLTSRALFQPLSSDNSLFSMHDLVNDLANFISGPFNVNLEGEHPLEIGSKTRHFSYIGTGFDEFKKFKALLIKAKQLRTFLAINMLPRHNKLAKEVLDDLLPMLSCLRVLSLSHYDNVTVLPKSIGKLKHLRYLNLSFTAIQSLPDSICKLCNLQTLKLLGCQYLATLPRDMWKLNNLRYFDITGSDIKKMPIHLGRLESLRALPSFIICKNIGSEISELGKLTNLQGKLSILELQEFPMDYPDPILGAIMSLKELVLEWNASDTNIPEREKTVLERLEPCTNLKRLTIKCYGGESFPTWVSRPSFSKIEVLHLYKCKHCCRLPPLGQLPFLLHLSIVGFDKIVSVGPEFCGSISSSSKPFGALKVLRFKQMLNWKEWFPSFTENEGGAFPHLEELCIDTCPKLVLQGSRICGSSSPIDPSWSGLFSTLKTLDITFAEMFDLPMCLDYPMYPSLTRLLLTHCCDSLWSIKLELFPELSEIKICGLRNLESLSIPKHYKQELKTSEIDIRDCPYFVSFPKGGLHAPSLTSLCIINCGSLRSLPDEMNKLLPSLEKLFIDDCPEVELAPEEGLPSSLYSISFNGFDKPIVGRSATRLARLPTVRNLVTGGKLEDTESHQSSGL